MSHLIVKDNALIEASYRLGEVEQRLVLLAILKARGQCTNVEQLKDKELIIHADDYIKVFGVDRDTAYKSLKRAVMRLYRAEWGYKYINKKGNLAIRYERFTQSAEYIENEATVKFMFSNAIIPLLIELEKRFTVYEIEQVSKLSSSYAMRLYEFLMQYLDKNTGKGWFEISLEDLRFRFGLLPNQYERMDNFKRKILDYSINEININTDLTVSYEQNKKGRIITGFKFHFKRKAKKTKLRLPKVPEKEVEVIEETEHLTSFERQVILSYVEEYFQTLEEKGEYITDFYRKNIIKKATKERWGLGDFEKQKEQERIKQQREQEMKAQQLAKEQQAQINQELEERRMQEMMFKFENLSPAQQEYILNQVEKQIPPAFMDVFQRERKRNIVHKNQMLKIYFYDVFGI